MVAQLLQLFVHPLPTTMGHPASHLYHSSSLMTALDQLQVSEAPLDARCLRSSFKASSVSLARRTVGFSKDGCEETFVALLPIAHQNQILRGFQPLFGGLHELLDERLVPSSNHEANQKAALWGSMAVASHTKAPSCSPHTRNARPSVPRWFRPLQPARREAPLSDPRGSSSAFFLVACALTPTRREVPFVETPSARCSATEMAFFSSILVLKRAVLLRSENSREQVRQRK